GNELGKLGEPDAYFMTAIAPDGKQVLAVVDKELNGGNIWRLEPTGVSSRLTFESRNFAQSPVWSHDGFSFIFGAYRGATLEIYRKASNGAGEEQLLLKSDTDNRPTSVSHDGRYLLYAARRRTPSERIDTDLWVLPLEPRGEVKKYVGDEKYDE